VEDTYADKQEMQYMLFTVKMSWKLLQYIRFLLFIFNVIRLYCLKYERSCRAQPSSSQRFSFSEFVHNRFFFTRRH